MIKSVYTKVALLLAAITLLSAGLTCLTAVERPQAQEVRIVTSFYPVYIAALNVADGIEGVEVVNLVSGQAGCLHDYQMSPADRTMLDSADILIQNGAGAEPFLDAALALYPTLPVIDLSDGQELLESGHVHTHENEEHDEEHEGETLALNSHLWVSPVRYRRQIETLRDGLSAADPEHAARYAENAASYLEQIDAVTAQLTSAAESLSDTGVVVFHDSLAYLAKDFSLPVAASLGIGEESGASAADLSKAEKALRGMADALFLYDSQYETAQYAYLQTIPENSCAVSVDICVSGEADKTRWIKAMTALCDAWKEAAA